MSGRKPASKTAEASQARKTSLSPSASAAVWFKMSADTSTSGIADAAAKLVSEFEAEKPEERKNTAKLEFLLIFSLLQKLVNLCKRLPQSRE